MDKKKLLTAFCITCVLLIPVLCFIIYTLQQNYKKLELKQGISNTQLIKTTKKNDSLQSVCRVLTQENKKMYSQAQLTEAMNIRDSVLRNVPFSVGDLVNIKPDLTPAVITDIVIGGDQYDYHINIVVKDSGKLISVLSPNMLVKKNEK